MLSYLHAFHAGNIADVQKNASLTLALSMMQVKPSGIACFDTHAGSAVYDLSGERARKTGEADAGVQALWRSRGRLASPDWARLLDVLAGLNSGEGRLERYPGSPVWFRQVLRPADTLTAFELHPAEHDQLSGWAADQRVRVLRQDGLAGLLKQLPPRQPRLLVLIDPSYEIKSEYSDVAATLEKAWQKCRHGVFLVWYPILPGGLQEALKDAVEAGPVAKVLCSEVRLRQPPERGMAGSGVLVVNPPWGFGERLATMMEAAAEPLGTDHTVRWLVPEA